MRKFQVTVNGKVYDVGVEEIAAGAPAPTQTPVASAPAAPAASTPVPAGTTKVEAPMPGSILDIKAANGQSVKAGDVLLILEAMKMENEIVAPVDGTVSAIHVNKGDTVDTGALLVSLG